MKTTISNKEKHSAAFPNWLTLFRVMLGIILLARGVSFFHDSSQLDAMIQTSVGDKLDDYSQSFSFIITFGNLLGGLFIATGLFTRWASLIQIPILIGALIFNLQASISFSNVELILSAFSLVMLIVFAEKGSGALSADEFFRSYTKAGWQNGHVAKLFQ